MQIFKLGDIRFTREDPALQTILKEAHDTGARPLCCCKSPDKDLPEMYVALVESGYVLKRMPRSGHQHAFFKCPSFAQLPELSGIGALLGSTIVTDDDGLTVLRTDYSLEKHPGRARSPSAADDVPGALKSQPAGLRLIGTLHQLWDKAGLSLWHPGLAKRRFWVVVRNRVSDAASRTRTKSVHFGERVFVPPVFDSNEEERLTRERDAFFHGLKDAQLGILIAEFKYRVDRKLYFKHLPRLPFFLERGASDRFDRKYAERIELKEEVEGARLIAIATFSYNRGFLDIDEIDMMPVTSEWLPFEHPREAELIKALHGREFVKSLRYNLGGSVPMASATLYDTDGPTALYAPPADISADAEQALRAAAERAPCRTWFWPASSLRMPPLPPKAGG